MIRFTTGLGVIALIPTIVILVFASLYNVSTAAPQSCDLDKVEYHFEVLPADVFNGGPDAVAEYFTHMQNFRGYTLIDIMMLQGVPFVVYSRPYGYVEPEATPTLERGSSL